MDVGDWVRRPHSTGLSCDARTRIAQLVVFYKECEEERCDKYFSMEETSANNALIHSSRALPAMLACTSEETHGEASKRISGHDVLKLQNSWSRGHLRARGKTLRTIIDSSVGIMSC